MPSTPLPKRPRVALFITCLTDQFYPHVGVAVTKILEQFGCTVAFPEAQTCCGQPFFNNGYHTETQELAKRFIEIFEPYDYIVTPSGSCCAMVREHYPHVFHGDAGGAGWHSGMNAVLGRTYEFVEFLDKVLKVNLSEFKLPQTQSVSYHFTCHLRGIGVKDEGTKLIKQIGNVEFRPLDRVDQCCGFGGTFAVKYPAISGAIVDDKVRCIEDTKAETLICNDAGCSMNISGMCHRKGMSTRVKHIAELMCEAMGIDAGAW